MNGDETQTEKEESKNDAERYRNIIEEHADVETEAGVRGVNPNHVWSVVKAFGEHLDHDYEARRCRDDNRVMVVNEGDYIVSIDEHNHSAVSKTIDVEIDDSEMWEFEKSKAEEAGLSVEELNREESIVHYEDNLRCAVVAVMEQCTDEAVDDGLVVLDN